jgi:predicted permease
LFGFALTVTGPIFLWVLSGLVVQRLGWFSADLNRAVSRIVFRFGLPVVLFFGATRVDYYQIAQARYLLAGVIATCAITLLAELYGRWRRVERGDRAVFVQGAYRSNLGVIGIALCAEAYGQEGLALAALPVAILTILYNLIAVVLLARAYGKSQGPLSLLMGVLTNPLIIGISLGALVSLLQLEVSQQGRNIGVLLTAVLIPAALFCIGASLDMRVLRDSSGLTLASIGWRLLLGPLLAVAIAVALGVHGAELGVLFLLTSAPPAAASYIMVVAAGGNGPLAANIVVIGTLLSSLTITLGLALLQISGWV